MSQLNDNLTEILRQKNAYLLPENLKKDVTCLGVTGTYEGYNKPYIELEYIESTGTQYIDTGYKVNMNTDIVEVEANVTRENGSHFVFGNYSSNNYYGFNFYGEASSLYFYYNLAQVVINTSHSGVGEITKLKATNTNFYVNNTSVGTFETVNNTTLYNAFIFGASTNNSVEFPSKMKLYSCKITSNNNVVRNFIPVKRILDNEICLYDKVTNTFFTNQGTGTFIAGPVKVETTMNIFVQTAEPNKKDGIWLQKNATPEHYISDSNAFEGETWASASETNNIPYQFYHGGLTSVGTDIYLLGGTGNDGATMKYNYKYDTLTKTYTRLTDIPINFYLGSAVSIGTDIYLLGSGNYPSNSTQYNYKYDTLTDTYTRLTDIPYNFYASSASVVGTNIYIFGGLINSTVYRKAYKYDTLTDTYTQLTNIPYDFYYGCTINVDNDIYLFGSSSTNYRRYAYKYDTLTDTYTQLTDIPYDFFAAGISAMGSNIYLFGGENGLRNCYKYDTLTDTYTQLTDIPYDFDYGDVISVNTDIYLLGSGSATNNTNVNRKFHTVDKTYSTDNSVVIAQGKPYNIGYTTKLFNTDFEIGFQPLYEFMDAWFYTLQDGLDGSMPVYYGNGANWINIKNPPQEENNGGED